MFTQLIFKNRDIFETIPVSVEGGGQHTVVIKIEPGLEEESVASDTTHKEQSQVYFQPSHKSVKEHVQNY